MRLVWFQDPIFKMSRTNPEIIFDTLKLKVPILPNLSPLNTEDTTGYLFSFSLV